MYFIKRLITLTQNQHFFAHMNNTQIVDLTAQKVLLITKNIALISILKAQPKKQSMNLLICLPYFLFAGIIKLFWRLLKMTTLMHCIP